LFQIPLPEPHSCVCGCTEDRGVGTLPTE